jgi:hydrogenase expression/formation protein HypC
MKIIQINGDMGVVEVNGIRREVGLMLLEGSRINDWVIVHAGFAIARLSAAEAKHTLKLFGEMEKETAQ